jgi:hypothetical protein
VGFIIVFRTNFGYQRYCEGRACLQNMTSRWSDAAIHLATFDRCALPADATHMQAGGRAQAQLRPGLPVGAGERPA